MITYLVANQKGGVGKTTTAVSVASELNRRGFKVLLIDADVQGNSSDTYQAEIEGRATLYDVILDEDRIPLAQAVQHTASGDIVPSDPLLRRADEILKSDENGIYRLKDATKNLEEYDYAVIDTNPAVNTMLHSALLASDRIIIPVTADRYALQGLSQLLDMIRAIRKRQNPSLKISGILLTQYSGNLNLSKDILSSLETVASKIGVNLFKTKIRKNVKVGEAQTKRTTLVQYAPSSQAARDYKAFVDELLGKEQ